MSEEAHRFKRKLKEIPIELDHPITEEPESYVIKELGGKVRAEYLNALNARISKGEIKDFGGIEALLLTRTLFERTSDGDEKVSAEFVGDLPASTLTELVNLSTELSGLHAKAEEEAKNED